MQKPTPPIHIGGRSRSAFRRAVQQGHGWYGFAITVEETAEAVAGLREAMSRNERPAELGELEISVTPRPRRDGTAVDAETVERYEEAGVDRLIPIVPQVTGGELDRFLESQSALIAGR